MPGFLLLSIFCFRERLCFWLLACFLLSGCKPEPSFQPAESPSLPLQALERFSRADSIIREMNTFPNSRKKVDSLLHLADQIKDYDTDAALKYANEAYKIAILKNLDLRKGISLYYMALLKKRKRKFGEGIADALADAEMSQKIFSRLDEKFWLAKAYNLIGIIHYREGKTTLAQDYQLQAMEAARMVNLSEKDSLSFIGEILHDLGNTYEAIDTAQALSHYQESLKYYRQAGNLSSMARVQNNIGDILTSLKRFDEANQYYRKSLDYSRKNQDNDNVAEVCSKLGLLYLQRYNDEGKESYFFAALEALNNGLSYQKENFYIPFERIGLTFHTRAYLTGDPVFVDSALYYYNRAMVEAGKEGAIPVMQNMVEMITQLCNSQAESARGGKTYCDQLFETSPEAFLNYNYRSIVDTLTITLQETNQRLVTFEREEVEILAWRKRRNLLFIGGIILLISTLAFLVLLQRQQQKRLKAQMNALRAQINPHFFSNSLNAIENLVNQNQPEAASRYLIHFSRLSRRILNGSREATTSLADELQTLKHFLALEQLRFRDKLQFDIQVSPGLDTDLIQVPAMILQPYAENAILHGIKPKPGPGLLQVRVERTGKHLICVVEDDGIGREKARQIKTGSVMNHKSVGMAITEERLKVVGKAKGAKVEIIDLHDTAGKALGTRVILRLPFKLGQADRAKTQNPKYTFFQSNKNRDHGQ